MALPTSTASAIELPNPGGSCSARQLVLSPPRAEFNFSTLGTRSLTVAESIHNSGDACDLAVPSVIAVASADGPYVAIAIPNVGNEVCVKEECKFVALPIYTIRAGASGTIWLHGWWPIQGTGISSFRPCAEPVPDVSRAQIPLAVGRLMIDWGIAFDEVCPLPATLNIAVELT